MRPKQTQEWQVGDFFAVKLADNSYGVGQVLDVSIPHTASCVFFDTRMASPEAFNVDLLDAGHAIGTATVIEAHLDQGAWKVLSHGKVVLPRECWPNEPTRNRRWVGSIVHTGAILERFLNAYHALSPWDQFHDPAYLDKLLISPSKKPKSLIYEKQGS